MYVFWHVRGRFEQRSDQTVERTTCKYLALAKKHADRASLGLNSEKPRRSRANVSQLQAAINFGVQRRFQPLGACFSLLERRHRPVTILLHFSLERLYVLDTNRESNTRRIGHSSLLGPSAVPSLLKTKAKRNQTLMN